MAQYSTCVCDRCGAEYPRCYDQRPWPTHQFKCTFPQSLETKKDLCDHCMEKLREVLRKFMENK